MGSKDLGNSWDVVGKDSEDAKDLVSSTSKDFSTFMTSWIDELFATIYRALGIDHEKSYMVGSRRVPLTDPGTEPVRAVLA